MGHYGFDRKIERTREVRVVGLDEVGRGPLAGPVVAAAVVLNLGRPIRGLDDSKKLNEATRENLYDKIVERAEAWAVAWCEPEEIDSINILQASLRAMEKALGEITSEWTLALVDGNQYMSRVPMEKQLAVVRGDGQSASIAAASIIAKVTRDRMMAEYHDAYPQYGFDRHKGYATAYHRESIERYGLCKLHRRSFCRTGAAQTVLPLDFGTV